ncbi:MAG: DNA repair protein RadC [Bacilli bacterium]|nr:DNA repair protein RadC [Bacilli bacterium]
MLIKEMNENDRPRERLANLGSSKLTNEELLAIILKTGSKGKSAKDLAIELIERLGKLENFKNLDLNSLREFKGIGNVKKIELLATLELGKRIYLNNPLKNTKRYTNPEFIYLDNKYLFYGLKQEYFYVFYLDTKKNLIERKLLFMGTIDRSLVHPREIFKEAYLLSASCFICMHNHPTGDVMPSRADISLTNTLLEIGRIQGIELLDHIIVSDSNYFSFYDNHLMENNHES